MANLKPEIGSVVRVTSARWALGDYDVGDTATVMFVGLGGCEGMVSVAWNERRFVKQEKEDARETNLQADEYEVIQQ